MQIKVAAQSNDKGHQSDKQKTSRQFGTYLHVLQHVITSPG
jgi:hypothetical protein